MRILIHDYSGHPFQVQLSRSLAKRNNPVLHVYSKFFQTPKGTLNKLPSDTPTFDCRGIDLAKPFPKYSFFRRRFAEIEYGHLLIKEVAKFHPEVVISSNTPLDPQKILLNYCKKNKIKFVFWVQDLYGIAIKKILSRKLPFAGALIGHYYQWLEFALLRASDQIIAITEDFIEVFVNQDIPEEKIHVIHNWAPLDELPEQPKENDWSRRYELHKTPCVLYSGTLGLKHNSELLLKLALRFKHKEHVKIVVISEGLGADYLKQNKEKYQLNNLLLLDFQSFDILPQVLGSADILVGILEQDAGIFSVPSKVLTYHCARRPLLVSMPLNNLAAHLIKEKQTGVVVAPQDEEEFFQAAEKLLDNDQLMRFYGNNARKYAEETFNIEKITDRFEQILNN